MRGERDIFTECPFLMVELIFQRAWLKHSKLPSKRHRSRNIRIKNHDTKYRQTLLAWMQPLPFWENEVERDHSWNPTIQK